MSHTSNTAREYLRVSVDRSKRERSPAEQHTDNQAAADARGWVLAEPYKDIGSASRYTKKRRADFERLLADLEADRFGASILLLWEGSRGSRKVSEWCRLIELCEARKVLVHITADGRTYNPADARDRRSLLEDAVDAEFESSKISKRVNRSAPANAAAGKPHGRVPFGFVRRYDPTTGKLIAQEIDPTESKVIRELFDRLHKGHSLRSIARDFEDRGIRSRTGKVFSQQHLRVLATLRCYVAERVHDPNRIHGTRLSETAVFTPATWPAVVKRDLFLAVQRKLQSPDRVTARPGRGVHLLSMIGICDVCSGPLSARVRKDTGNPRAEYVCHKASHVRVPYEDLNRFVELTMLLWLAHPENVDRLTAQKDGGKALEEARATVATIRLELDDLADRVGAGKISAMLAARAEPKILARLKAAEEHESELARPVALRGLISPGRDVKRRWAAAPMSTKREVARFMLSADGPLGELRITRSPGRRHTAPIEERVTWRKP